MDSLSWDNLRRRADGTAQHSASFDANGGTRPRQEFAWRLLCNRQWAIRLEISSESTRTLFRSARMPVRVREMSSAIPLAAALAILLSALVAAFIRARNCLTELFFGFHGCCVHRILHGSKDGAAGEMLPAGAFHDANLVHAAASNIHPSIAGFPPLAHPPPPPTKRPPRALLRSCL